MPWAAQPQPTHRLTGLLLRDWRAALGIESM